LKVIHYINSASFGGIEKLVLDLLEEQQKRSYLDPWLLIGKNKGDYLNMYNSLDVQIIFQNYRAFDLLRINKIIKLRNSLRGFQVIHLHSFNPVVALVAYLSKSKVIYTEHGNFGFGRKRQLKDGINQALKLVFLKRLVNFITFNSVFTSEYANKKYGLKQKKQQVVYNGIKFNSSFDTNIDTEVQKGLLNKFVVGTSSRFAGFKRIDRLIRAFSIFAKEREDVVLLLVGDGILLNELKELVKVLNLSSKTIFAGYQQNVRAFQNNMNVCVFPSQNEPFGLVALETLSLGKPTLVFKDGGGIKEIVSLVEKKDIVSDTDELTERLTEYYVNEISIKEKVGHRQEIAHSFNVAKMENSFYEIYKAL
jgi:glycosyltransferase involved in cell wall biosynthesis